MNKYHFLVVSAAFALATILTPNIASAQDYLVDPVTKQKSEPKKAGQAAKPVETEKDQFKSQEERRKAFDEKHKGQRGKLPEDVQRKMNQTKVENKNRTMTVQAGASNPAARKAEAQQAIDNGKKEIAEGRKKIKDAKDKLAADRKAKRISETDAKDKEAKIKRAEEELGKLEKSISEAETELKAGN